MAAHGTMIGLLEWMIVRAIYHLEPVALVVMSIWTSLGRDVDPLTSMGGIQGSVHPLEVRVIPSGMVRYTMY